MRLFYKIEYMWDKFRGRYQRFKQGYSYGDVWNMFDWFIGTVKPMLVHLRDHGIGIPQELYVEGENERAQWESVITEMINCLDMMDENNVEKHLGFNYYGAWKDMTKDDCDKINKIMTENKNKFFELFSKYFYDLWD